MNHLLVLLLIVGGLGAFGCSNVQTEHVILEGATFSEYSPNQKVVVLSEHPKKPYTKIAKLRATAEEPTSEKELTQGLIEEARKVGGDAIIDVY